MERKPPTTTLPKGDAVQRYHAGHLHVLKHPTGLSALLPTAISPCRPAVALASCELRTSPEHWRFFQGCLVEPGTAPSHLPSTQLTATTSRRGWRRHHRQTQLPKRLEHPANLRPPKPAARTQHTEASATFLGFFFYFFFFFFFLIPSLPLP